jgi:hypothetical protein
VLLSSCVWEQECVWLREIYRTVSLLGHTQQPHVAPAAAPSEHSTAECSTAYSSSDDVTSSLELEPCTSACPMS